MSVIGRTVQVASITLGVAIFLAAAWPLAVGGVADLASAGPISTGIAPIDGFDDELRADWGELELGLLKLLVLLPIALLLAAVIARGGIALGRSLRARSRPHQEARPPATIPAVSETPEAQAAIATPEESVATPAPVVVHEVPVPRPEPDEAPPEVAPVAAPAPSGQATVAPVASTGHVDGLLPVGETVTLHGIDREQTVVEVTLEDVGTLPAAAPTPAGSEQLLTVLLRLRNVGAALYVDYPTGGASIVCSDGTLLRPARHRREPALREIRLQPGEQVEGFLTFELPDDPGIRSLRFALDVGVAPESAAWEVTASVAGA